MLVDHSNLFTVGTVDPFGDDFNGSVWTIGFADAATCATMLVVLVVGHEDLTFETLEHDQFLPVFRILLRDDLSGTEEIFPGYGHTGQQRLYTVKDICEVFKKAAHSLKVPTH